MITARQHAQDLINYEAAQMNTKLKGNNASKLELLQSQRRELERIRDQLEEKLKEEDLLSQQQSGVNNFAIN